MRNSRSGRSQKKKAAGKTKALSGDRRRNPVLAVFSFLVSVFCYPFCSLGEVIAHYPRQSFLGALAAGVSLSIIMNALLFQEAPHPAPFFARAERFSPSVPVPAESPVQQAALIPNEPDLQNPEIMAEVSPVERLSDTASIGMVEFPEQAEIIEEVPLPPMRRAENNLQSIINASLHENTVNETVQSRGVSADPDQVRKVQMALVMQGYSEITVDGLWGPATRRAIEAFEKSRGLPVTGEINIRTYQALTGSRDIAQTM